MDIRVLRYYIAAVENGTISGAAEALGLTQPTLSRQLMDLEKELGCRLLERSTRKLRLTEKGEVFLERARTIVRLSERTIEEMRASSELTGEIRIAAGETQGMRLLALAMRRLREEAPGVRFQLTSGAYDTVRSQLDAGITDFGLFVGAVDLRRYASIKLPTRDRFGLITTRTGPLGGRTELRPEDFEGLPLIMSHQSAQNREFLGWLGTSADKVRLIGTFNLLYNACIMAEAGIGHVMAIEGVIWPSAFEGLCWIPLAPQLEADLHLAWNSERRLSAAALRFLEIFREESARPSNDKLN